MFHKKNVAVVDNSEAIKDTIPVFFGGQQIGEVIRVKAKEIGGLSHFELILKLTFGSGLELQIRDVLIAQGLYIGEPPNGS